MQGQQEVAEEQQHPLLQIQSAPLEDGCCSLVPAFTGLYKQQKTQYFFLCFENTTDLKESCDSISNEIKGSKDTKIKPSEDGSENKFFPRKLLALDNPEEGRKRTRRVLQLLFTHQVSQGEAIPGVLTFSFSWYRTGLRTEKGCSTAVLHEHTVQDSLKSQDTAAANSLSCLFIIEETHSSKFCVGFSVTRSFLVVTAPQL